MRRLLKRIIPFLISILMVVTLLPQVSLAADEDEPTTPLTELSIENLTIMEHTNGTYDGPNGYYYYPMEIEDLRVGYVYNYESGEGTWDEFISFLTEQTGEEVEYEIITGQEEEAWKGGQSYPVQVKLLGLTETFYVTIEKQIDDFLNSKAGYLQYLPARLLKNCVLLPIEADSQDTALRIFSTLNNRGLPLSDSDIFKAELYKFYSKNNKTITDKLEYKNIDDINFITSLIEKVLNKKACIHKLLYRASRDGDSSINFHKNWHFFKTLSSCN